MGATLPADTSYQIGITAPSAEVRRLSVAAYASPTASGNLIASYGSLGRHLGVNLN